MVMVKRTVCFHFVVCVRVSVCGVEWLQLPILLQIPLQTPAATASRIKYAFISDVVAAAAAAPDDDWHLRCLVIL